MTLVARYARRFVATITTSKPDLDFAYSEAFARSAALGLCLLFACGFPVVSQGTEKRSPFPDGVRVLDLGGRSVNPFEATEAKAFVLIFVSVECPISNGYIPEYRRLEEQFSAKGFVFRLVYPNQDESAEAVQKHLGDFKCPLKALRDPQHALVKAAGVRVTPEAAVFVPDSGVLYRGRIDNRHVELGKARPAATTHDLRDALDAILKGKLSKPRVTRAVGCYIAGTP